jgi:hypothetical protein
MHVQRWRTAIKAFGIRISCMDNFLVFLATNLKNTQNEEENNGLVHKSKSVLLGLAIVKYQ